MTIKETSYSNKIIARSVGVLFIIATVAAILSVAILEPILKDLDQLQRFSENGFQIISGVLLDLVGAGAFVALAIMIFPILKKQNESIALGYVIARSIEAVPFMIANLSLLAFLTVGQEYVQASASDVSGFMPVSTGLLAIYNWGQILGPRIFASLAAIPFYYLLYRSKLVPRWMSVWGLLGAPLYFTSGFLSIFNLVDPFSPLLVILFLPAALLEMVLAVWLIVKGFNPRALQSEEVTK